MSKIICDVCGTAYQESATQCPICGCVRPVEVSAEVEAEEARITRAENYTYVKGGRFSKANVQKRNQGLLNEVTTSAPKEDNSAEPKNNKSDRGLVIAVCALLLAIIAVVIYIVVHFFTPADSTSGNQNDTNDITDSPSTIVTTEASAAEEIFCDSIVLSAAEIALEVNGEKYSLEATLNPADTTDEIVFASQDESVATVSADGEIAAVGAGETIITVTCGSASAQCRVTCSVVEETTVPTVPAETYTGPFKLNKNSQGNDVMIGVGESFALKLFDANRKVVPVVWEVEDPDICKVDGNTVTGVTKGKTKVFVTYEGETYACIVRVR